MKNKIIKTIATFSMISLILISSTAQLYAASAAISYDVNAYNSKTYSSKSSDISVKVRFSDDLKTEVQGKLIFNNTYVALRSFLNSIGGFNIKWNQKTKTANATSDEYHIIAQINKYELFVNDSKITMIAENKLIDNVTYVPIRPLAESMGYNVKWEGVSKTVTLTKHVDSVGSDLDDKNYGTYGSFTARADSFYDQDDLYWLSRIISAESRGESIEGKLAVGSVVMNRVEHKNYPGTIKDVIFDKKYAVQFTPVSNGSIYYDPTDESVFAAKIILEGYKIDEEIIYFVDTKVSPNSWVERNNTFVFKIGCHSFFK